MSARRASRTASSRFATRRCFQPRLELLETRIAPAVFNVPNGPDPGTNIGSLGAAIQLADTNDDTTNIINVAPGTYSVINQQISAATSGASTKTLTIVGQDQGVFITANQVDRVFTVNANLVFQNLRARSTINYRNRS